MKVFLVSLVAGILVGSIMVWVARVNDDINYLKECERIRYKMEYDELSNRIKR